MTSCACSMRLQFPGDLAHQAGPSLPYSQLSSGSQGHVLHNPLPPSTFYHGKDRASVSSTDYIYIFKSPYFLTWGLCETLVKRSTTASLGE